MRRIEKTVSLMLSLLLLISGCVSCGFEEQKCNHRTNIYEEIQAGPHTRARDPQLTPIIKQFLKDFKGLVPEIYLDPEILFSYRYETILPDEDGTNIIGQCISWTFGQKEMVISPELYDSEWLQKAVVYHELGHCLFDLDHDPDQSLMSEYIYGNEQFWKNNWAEELAKFKEYVNSQIEEPKP